MKKISMPRYLQWIMLTGGIFIALMSALRWILIVWFRNPATEKIPLGEAFLLGLRFDLRFAAIFLVVLYLIHIIPSTNTTITVLKKRMTQAVCLLFIVVFGVFYVVDFANYAYLQQRVSANILNFLDDAKISLAMLQQSYHLGWGLLALAVAGTVLFVLVQFSYQRMAKEHKVYGKYSHILWGFFFLLSMAYFIVGNVVLKGGQYPLRWSDAFALGNDYAANISLNPFQSFFSTLSYRESGYDEEKVRKYYAWISEYLGVPENERESVKLNFQRKIQARGNDTISSNIENVVLVLCESFSAYKSTMYGNPLGATPYFNKLCKQGVFFDRAFSPAYGTARGVWATITGIPDVNLRNTSSRNPNVVNQHSIMNDFKNKEKYYFLGGSTSWANIRGLLTNNIENLHIYEQGKYTAEEIDVWGISDKNLFLEANKVLRQETKPFFAIIQTADNHRPYTIPKEDLTEFNLIKFSIDTLKKYGFESHEEYNAFRYMDFCLRKFMENAKKEAYFEKTLFVFIGDHGIRGNATKILPNVFTEQGINNMHVPLLFYAPNALEPAVYNTPASQIDVLPSIAHLCNLSYVNTTLGRNLFDVIDRPDNHVFLFDDFRKLLGVFNSSYYYNYHIDNPEIYSFSSVTNNEAVQNDSAATMMRFITDAFYETSKYMLQNNRKQELLFKK